MQMCKLRIAFAFALLIALAAASPTPQTDGTPNVPGTPGHNLKNKMNVTPVYSTQNNTNPGDVQTWSDNGPNPNSTKPIEYHGGTVLTDPINVYMIYYGGWSSNMTDLKILEDLVTNLGGSGYWSTLTNYYSSGTVKVKGSLKLSGTVIDDYSFGTEISIFSGPYVVGAAILKANWPADPKAVYVIVASNDVWHSSGYCSTFCGFHTFDTILSKTIKYIYLGTPTDCLDACGPVYTKYPAPNRNPALDAMASTLVHEMAETVTNPEWNDKSGSWYDADGWEVADKCVWQFGLADGQVNTDPDTTKWNVQLGSRKYLLQQLWDNSKQKCGKVRP